MRYAYPCILTPDEEEGEGFVVTFPDVPEAITGGNTREEALMMAQDGLAVALGMYVKSRQEIPVPSGVAPGQVLVAVPYRPSLPRNWPSTPLCANRESPTSPLLPRWG